MFTQGLFLESFQIHLAHGANRNQDIRSLGHVQNSPHIPQGRVFMRGHQGGPAALVAHTPGMDPGLHRMQRPQHAPGIFRMIKTCKGTQDLATVIRRHL